MKFPTYCTTVPIRIVTWLHDFISHEDNSYDATPHVIYIMRGSDFISCFTTTLYSDMKPYGPFFFNMFLVHGKAEWSRPSMTRELDMPCSYAWRTIDASYC